MRLRTEVEGRPGRIPARPSVAVAVLAAAALTASACGGDSSTGRSEQAADAAVPTILVTTGIWADVVTNVACGGLASIETIIPVGGDPHGYEPSLQDRARMENAALVVANGLELEEALKETLEAVEESGTPVFEFADAMETIPFAFESGHHGEAGEQGEGHDEDEEGGEEGEDHDEDDEDGHGSGGDPHVWFDPRRVSGVLPALAERLTADVGLDAGAVEACLSLYRAELAAVDSEIIEVVDRVPVEQRKLVTNHDALGYFADRYGFEVIGTVIPAAGTMAQTNPAQLEELAELIENEGVKAIFAETLHSTDDAEALASRLGDVEVVTLYTGSLGPSGSGAETYIGFIRTNVELIVDALG